MPNTSHQTQVLNHLKQGKTISQAEAIYHFNCYRLSAVIQRLRKQGHDIVTHNESNLNGKGTHARYELRELQA
ncbi:DNA-binding protein [Acinetobacter sp. ANC 4635]|uniref:helix-turn-helix domain-containing protein n=1 Tax=Acinetobacter sp. ANC 4635 TaxID=2529846 RepID=UPI00103ACFB9|nr:helix-turn-helix domain-containing protein [Acinetobacter sp. ANC 4635]TCB33190.1 DNA-binding protein [Acinetobacter sp. ANC 4635]